MIRFAFLVHWLLCEQTVEAGRSRNWEAMEEAVAEVQGRLMMNPGLGWWPWRRRGLYGFEIYCLGKIARTWWLTRMWRVREGKCQGYLSLDYVEDSVCFWVTHNWDIRESGLADLALVRLDLVLWFEWSIQLKTVERTWVGETLALPLTWLSGYSQPKRKESVVQTVPVRVHGSLLHICWQI